MFVFLYLVYFLSMTISRSIHVAANGIISFFLWLSNITFYIYAPLLLSIKIFATLSLCILLVEKHKDIKNKIIYNLITLDNDYFGIFYF